MRCLRSAALAVSLSLGAVLVAPGARADDGHVYEVTVRPKGQPWSIGRWGGQECDPVCTLHLRGDKYAMEIGGAKETLTLAGPVDISYRPGSSVLRWVGLGMGVGGLAIGGIMIYVVAKSCIGESNSSTNHCDVLKMTPPVQRGVITFTAVLLSAAVAGGILFALSGESIRVDDAPEPPKRPVGFHWQPLVGGFPASAGPALHGATAGVEVRF